MLIELRLGDIRILLLHPLRNLFLFVFFQRRRGFSPSCVFGCFDLYCSLHVSRPQGSPLSDLGRRPKCLDLLERCPSRPIHPKVVHATTFFRSSVPLLPLTVSDSHSTSVSTLTRPVPVKGFPELKAPPRK